MASPTATAQPTLPRLFLLFARISLTSFGGGLSGWLLREVVTARGWISEEEFLNGLAVSQALPGVNVANMSTWIGYRLFGWVGVLFALAGMILPAAVVIVVLATCLETVARFAITQEVLVGAGAAAIGLSLAMGIAAGLRVTRRPMSLTTMALTFVGAAILHWPAIWIVVGFGGASALLRYRALRNGPA
jgi:chromate transporter